MNSIIEEVLTELNNTLSEHIPTLSYYAYGIATDTDDISAIINNGFCHAYATIAYERLLDRGIVVSLVGSPTHVFMKYGIMFFDAANVKGSLEPLTRYPYPFIDYSKESKIEEEFYAYREALSILRGITG